ncbi:CHASE2 domain-containing protein [Bacteroidales bacterium OttesenSCG-928-A17]|nr:CHASE2 domain-containing protein [Bacteroidales bacterium OttesenSCG-928-A17]
MKPFFATILSLIMCVLFYMILDINIIDHFSEQDSEADVINFFYKVENRDSDDDSHLAFFDDKIVIYDLEGNNSRREIADAIAKISGFKPKAIVLDIIFPETAAIDSASNQYLEETIKSCDAIFIACRYASGKMERSFFAEDSHFKEGLTNNITHFKPTEEIDGIKYNYLPYLTIDIDAPENTHLLVNYKDKAFKKIAISDSLFSDEISDRVIIVGDLSDLRDTHDMPFKINGSKRVSGMILLAHTFSTINNETWIIRTKKWINIVIAFVFTFSFTCLCYWLRNRVATRKKDDSSNKKKSKSTFPVWSSFIERTARVFLVLLMMFGGYILFTKGLFTNLTYAMISVALTGLSIDITDLIEHYKCTLFNKFKKR